MVLFQGGEGRAQKRNEEIKVRKWVEPSVPDSSPQRASETTGMGTVGCNERSELHRLFDGRKKADVQCAALIVPCRVKVITRMSEYASLFEFAG